jgi:hypothetical protein
MRKKPGWILLGFFYVPAEKISGKIESFLDYGLHAKRDNTENRKFRSLETAK